MDDRSRVALTDFGTRLTGLPGASGRLSRLPHGMSLTNDRTGTNGVGFRLTPSGRGESGLALETAYVDRRPEARNMPATRKGNDVWSVALTGSLLDERLRVHTEYAISRQGVGMPAGGRAEGSANAYDLRLRYRGHDLAVAGRPFRWSVTADRREAQDGFWTLSTHAIPRGAVVDRVATDLSWGEVDSRVSYARAEDRPEAASGVHWQRNTLAARVACSGPSLGGLPGIGWLLGEPRYSVSARRELRVPQEGPDDAAAELATRAGVTFSFDPGPWRWELRHSQSESHALERVRASSGTRRTAVRVNVPLGGRVRLRPEFQWNVHGAPGEQRDSSTLAGALGASAVLVPDALNARLRLRASRRRMERRAVSGRVLGVESGFEWTLSRQRLTLPQVKLSLEGRYEYASEAGSRADGEARYRAYASLTMRWPDGG